MRRCAIAFLGVHIACSAMAQAPRYHAERILAPDDRATYPLAMSPAGDIYIGAFDGRGLSLARWNGSWSTSQPYPYNAFGVSAVNRSGEMAAVFTSNWGETWTVGRAELSGVTELTPHVSHWITTAGINDSGTILVSTEDSATRVSYAYTVSTAGTIVPLAPKFAGDYVTATALNNAGEALAQDSAFAGAGIWRDGILVQELPVPAEFSTAIGQGLNNAGVVLGNARATLGGPGTPMRWVSGHPEILPSLAGLETRTGWVNDAGQILGWIEEPTYDRRGVTWIDGQVYDLASLVDDSSLSRLNPIGIDDSGRIFATTLDANSDYVLWVLSPVPTPGSSAVLCVLGLAVARRRR